MIFRLYIYYLRHYDIYLQSNNINKQLICIYTIMAQTAMTVRLDNQQKVMFDQLCEQFGMSANTAINIFVRQVIRCRRIPFVIAAPEKEDDLRAKTIQVFQKIRGEAEAQTEPEMSLEEINAEINAVREARQTTI